MSPPSPPSALGSALRFFIRTGKSFGIAIFVCSVVGLLYLRLVVTPHVAVHDAWPTEGYYFAGAQYQITMQSLRLSLAGVHLAASEEARQNHRRDANVLRDVLHAKYDVFVNSSDLAPPFREIPGFQAAIGTLTALDSDLNTLVADAMGSPAGLERFNERVADTYDRVIGMVNDLRVAELAAFEAAFEAQRRVSIASQEIGLALLAVLGLGLAAHFHLTRRERQALTKEAQARAEAQRSAQARTALLGMVSHELRTPLQTIMADTEYLAGLFAHSDAHEPLGRMERTIDLISGQLDNIAQYARLTSGNEELRHERFLVGTLLRRIVEEHAETARQATQVLKLDKVGNADVTVLGDPIRLHQVVNNYVANAIKYAGPGEITVSYSVMRDRLRADADQIDVLDIRVADHGPGIPEADQASIWEPFVRGRRGPDKPKGSGLGLAVVKLLASSAQWSVGVLSSPGNGATFYVRVPISPDRTRL